VLDETLDEIDPVWRRRILDYLRDNGSTVLLFSSKFPDIYREYGAVYFILSGGTLIQENEQQQDLAIREGLLLAPQSGDGDGDGDGEADQRVTERKAGEIENQALISVRDLDFNYPGMNGFSLHIDHLEIYPGEVLAMTGPNGCGKTTLAKLLCGLYRPKSGNISLPQNSGAGQPAGNLGFETLRTMVAYIFQNPDYQIFLSSVQEELAYGLKEMGCSTASIRKEVDEAIRLFKLPSADSAPSLMSYGTRKRLQAATYWLLDRPVCVLDEADSGLSVRDFAEIISLFRSKNRAILVITHNEELAQRFSDRVLAMENGGIRTGEQHD
jgi:energy-coupling factor transport system ATP-binding protein